MSFTNYFSFKVDICEQKLFKVGCKYLFNLIKFIEMDEDLKEKSKNIWKWLFRKMKLLNYENIKINCWHLSISLEKN